MDKGFSHCALSLNEEKKLIYTAFSKHYFYYRMHISRFVLERNCVPLNPFMLFDYFLLDTVDRDLVRNANNAVVMRADEVWIFGPISNGVLAEILLAKKSGKPLSFFKIESSHFFCTITPEEAEMEEEVRSFRHLVNT